MRSRYLSRAATVAAVVVVLCAGAASAAIVDSDVISYWKFDGDLLDSAPSFPIHHGTYDSGSPVFVAGQSGLALDLTGARVGRHVTTTLQLGAGAKTMVLWMARSATSPPTQALWAGNATTTNNRFYLGRDAGGPWIGGGTSSSAAGAFSAGPFNGQFQMFALVDNGSTLTAYQNGNPTPINTFTYSGSTATDTSFRIGQAGGSTPINADALLDDISLYNRALTTDELADLFAAGSLEQYFINAELAALAAIPEPASSALLGLGCLALVRRRRK